MVNGEWGRGSGPPFVAGFTFRLNTAAGQADELRTDYFEPVVRAAAARLAAAGERPSDAALRYCVLKYPVPEPAPPPARTGRSMSHRRIRCVLAA